MPFAPVALATALTLLVTGCAGRGSAEDQAAADAATQFLAAVGTAPESGCDLLAPATLEQARVRRRAVRRGVGRGREPGSPGSGEPRVDVYGRDAMVRWGGATLFLARFDDGWRVTAAGCEPRGKDLPYDCTIEGR